MPQRTSSPLLALSLALTLTLALTSCSRPEAAPAGSESTAPAAAAAPEFSPGGESKGDEASAHLPFPFTPEQIRDEMTLGFTAVIKTTSPEGEELQRWTVVGWDDDGVEIEYAALGGSGEVVGEPQVKASTWVELRDHATFDASVSTREEHTMETPIGELSGWLYRVPDEEAQTESSFFFAAELPGAPIVLRVEKDGETVMTFEQLERHRPEVFEESGN